MKTHDDFDNNLEMIFSNNFILIYAILQSMKQQINAYPLIYYPIKYFQTNDLTPQVLNNNYYSPALLQQVPVMDSINYDDYDTSNNLNLKLNPVYNNHFSNTNFNNGQTNLKAYNSKLKDKQIKKTLTKAHQTPDNCNEDLSFLMPLPGEENCTSTETSIKSQRNRTNAQNPTTGLSFNNIKGILIINDKELENSTLPNRSAIKKVSKNNLKIKANNNNSNQIEKKQTNFDKLKKEHGKDSKMTNTLAILAQLLRKIRSLQLDMNLLNKLHLMTGVYPENRNKFQNALKIAEFQSKNLNINPSNNIKLNKNSKRKTNSLMDMYLTNKILTDEKRLANYDNKINIKKNELINLEKACDEEKSNLGKLKEYLINTVMEIISNNYGNLINSGSFRKKELESSNYSDLIKYFLKENIEKMKRSIAETTTNSEKTEQFSEIEKIISNELKQSSNKNNTQKNIVNHLSNIQKEFSSLENSISENFKENNRNSSKLEDNKNLNIKTNSDIKKRPEIMKSSSKNINIDKKTSKSQMLPNEKIQKRNVHSTYCDFLFKTIKPDLSKFNFTEPERKKNLELPIHSPKNFENYLINLEKPFDRLTTKIILNNFTEKSNNFNFSLLTITSHYTKPVPLEIILTEPTNNDYCAV